VWFECTLNASVAGANPCWSSAAGKAVSVTAAAAVPPAPQPLPQPRVISATEAFWATPLGVFLESNFGRVRFAAAATRAMLTSVSICLMFCVSCLSVALQPGGVTFFSGALAVAVALCVGAALLLWRIWTCCKPPYTQLAAGGAQCAPLDYPAL
jgi:hypothetical protein